MNEHWINTHTVCQYSSIFIGVYGFLTRKNMITMLMAIELILNSVNINFVAFNKFLYADKLRRDIFHGFHYHHSSSRSCCSNSHYNSLVSQH
jgi:NADH:ubiquinone oxidoreductase subunit K